MPQTSRSQPEPPSQTGISLETLERLAADAPEHVRPLAEKLFIDLRLQLGDLGCISDTDNDVDNDRLLHLVKRGQVTSEDLGSLEKKVTSIICILEGKDIPPIDIEMGQDLMDRAEEFYEMITDADTKKSAREDIALQRVRLGEHRHALEIIRSLMFPDTRDEYYDYIAAQLLRNGHLSEVIKYVAEEMRNHRATVSVLCKIAAQLHFEGKECIDYISRAEEVSEQDDHFHSRSRLEVVTAYAKIGHFEEALRAAEDIESIIKIQALTCIAAQQRNLGADPSATIQLVKEIPESIPEDKRAPHYAKAAIELSLAGFPLGKTYFRLAIKYMTDLDDSPQKEKLINEIIECLGKAERFILARELIDNVDNVAKKISILSQTIIQMINSGHDAIDYIFDVTMLQEDIDNTDHEGFEILLIALAWAGEIDRARGFLGPNPSNHHLSTVAVIAARRGSLLLAPAHPLDPAVLKLG